jgi:hypothetical protein
MGSITCIGGNRPGLESENTGRVEGHIHITPHWIYNTRYSMNPFSSFLILIGC